MADLAAIQEKLDKGENLTAAELKEVMSAPPEGYNGAMTPEDDLPEEHFGPAGGQPAAKDGQEGQPGAKEGQPAKAPEAAKTPAPAAPEDPMVRLTRELAKPDGQEDLKGWTDTEKAYFHEMKRERKKRQEAEGSLDLERRERIKQQKKQTDEEAKKAQEEFDAVFKDKKDEDQLSVAEVKKLFETGRKLTPLSTESPQQVFDPTAPIVTAALRIQEDAARKEYADYDYVIEQTAAIIKDNPEYIAKIGSALRNGENCAKVTYDLIKNDPRFVKSATPQPAKQDPKPAQPAAKADAEALAAQAALEKNANANKTSAHVAGEGAGGKVPMFGKYTANELLNMPDDQFRKVPKKDRDAFLKWSSLG